jgi:DNA-binding transcriptional MerR regulator
MTVVNNMLLIRRINDLHRKRDALIERQDRMRSVLPDWTLEPLRMAGMSVREIERLMSEVSAAEQQTSLEQIERDVERVDQQIEEAENQLISSPNKSLDGLETVLRLAVDRLRRQVSTDPNDVFYDYGEARVVFMLDNVLDDLHAFMREGERAAG